MKQFPLLPILLLVLLSSTANSVSFTCTSPSTATCQSLAGYIPANSTTLGHIQSLFQVPSLQPLLGANNLPLNTLPSLSIPNGTTVYVPFPCRCRNGTGVSDGVPIYTKSSNDTGLDAIARYTFDQFVTYQEIGKANGIKNMDSIPDGQRLLIPLPCSCDRVDGDDVVHLGHVVAPGSSVSEIAGKFGTTDAVLQRLNGITDPRKLQAGQVVDVPIKACSSSILSESLDHGLRLAALPNGTYAVTAENCVQCSCSSSSANHELSCKPIQGLSKSQCPVAKCGSDMFIGNSTSQGCKITTCAYQGYTNATGLNILSGLTHSTCNDGAPAPQPVAGNPPPAGNSPPSGSFAGRLRARGHQIGVLVLVQVALFWFSF